MNIKNRKGKRVIINNLLFIFIFEFKNKKYNF